MNSRQENNINDGLITIFFTICIATVITNIHIHIVESNLTKIVQEKEKDNE